MAFFAEARDNSVTSDDFRRKATIIEPHPDTARKQVGCTIQHERSGLFTTHRIPTPFQVFPQVHDTHATTHRATEIQGLHDRSSLENQQLGLLAA